MRIGRYQLLNQIADGATGVVYEAELLGPAGFRKRVALKLLTARGRLTRVARLSGLYRHRNLVEIYDVGEVDGHWYCAMELIPDHLAKHLPLTPQDAIEAALQVCAAIGHAHRELDLCLTPTVADLLFGGGAVKVLTPPDAGSGDPMPALADLLAELGAPDVVVQGCRDGSMTTPAEVATALRQHEATAHGLDELRADKTSATAQTNVASQSAPMIGRERELAELLALLDDQRLVAVVGPPGVGKTRLAREVGRAHLRRGEVWECDVSRTASQALLLGAIARELDIVLPSQDPASYVGQDLARRGAVVLLLDGFDDLGDAITLVQGWVARAPELRVLVTRRAASTLPTLRLGPLSDADAVQMLVHLAPKTTPSAEVTELARRLDGLPLALELAAGRLGLLTPAQLLHRLDRRFALLRHRDGAALATVLASSWELLSPEDREALARLTVFRGGFDLDGATAVLGDWSALDRLVDQSWVIRHDDRFDLLTSQREYAEQQAAAPNVAAAAAAHAVHYTDLGSPDGLGALARQGGARRMRKLHRELENLTVAVHRSLATGDGERASNGVLALARVVAVRGPVGGARPLLEAVLPHAPPARRSAVLRELGWCVHSAGDSIRGLEFLERALATARERGDTGAEAVALENSGAVRITLSDIHTGIEDLQASIATYDASRAGGAYNLLGIAHMRLGHMELALSHVRRAIDLLSAKGHRRLEAAAQLNAGMLLQLLGREAEARVRYRSAERLHRETV
jgi:predicted ATPase